MTPLRFVIPALGLLLLPAGTHAASPPDTSYQGRLLDAAGEPLTGTADLEIGVFDQLAGGAPLYQEQHPGVVLSEGVFAIVLGTGSNPSGSYDATLFSGQNRFLELRVDGETLAPRQPLHSTPYALQCEIAGSAERVGSVAAADVVTTTNFAMTFEAAVPEVSEGQIPPAIARTGDVDAVDQTLQAEIDALTARVAALEALLAGVTRSGETLRLSGMNLQIVNGLGVTTTANSLGNLIVGYNEARSPASGETDRSGSHNVVIGSEHNYRSFGGLVAGKRNELSGTFASVSAGFNNLAGADFAAVSGGQDNQALATGATVSGGLSNSASGPHAQVSGGESNAASGGRSSVSGGTGNLALFTHASVTGGTSNRAEGSASSVTGGLNNRSIGSSTSVTGGRDNLARDDFTSVVGGRSNQASGDSTSISGGRLNGVSGDSTSISGGRDNQASGDVTSIGGGVENDATGVGAHVSGGFRGSASGEASAVAGGQSNAANGNFSSVGGGKERVVNDANDWQAGGLFQDF